jgi:hypothetical protein
MIMDNNNDINNKAEQILAAVRKTVMVANMSLSTILDTPFMASYESNDGVLVMALRPNNTAVLVAAGDESNTVIQVDVLISEESIVERRSVFKCETTEDSDQIWGLLNEKLFDWSQNQIATIEIN